MIIYIVAAIFITWPLATQLTTHIAGSSYSDSYENVRLAWWGKYALQQGINPFYQSLLAYPDGFFSTTQWMQPLMYWPISLLAYVMSVTTAFNLWIVLEIILSGLSAYWLCRDVIRHESHFDNPQMIHLAALVGGLIFMAFPTVQGHLIAGHLNPLSNYTLPLAVLCLYRIITRRGGVRTALLGAFWLWILALGNYTFSVFALLPILLFGGGYVVIFRTYRGSVRARGPFRDLILMFLVSLILILPFYLPTIADALNPVKPGYLQEGGWVDYSADPLSFAALSPFVPWTSPFLPSYSRTVLGTNSTEGSAYLGLVAVILSILGMWHYRRRAGLWLTIMLGCMIFSLGPLLKWDNQIVTFTLGGYTSNIVLPWAFFQNLPLINVTRTPGRFNMTTGLALGVLASLGLAYVLSRLVIPWRRLALTSALLIFVLLEYQLFFPFPTVPIGIPGQAYFESLAARSDIHAVFDLPMDDPIGQKLALYEQTFHHKPMIAGYVSRRTSVDPAKIAILSGAARGNVSILDSRPTQQDDYLSTLNANNVDVIVYHRQLFTQLGIQRAGLIANLGQPKYEDDQIIIFEVPKATTQNSASLVGILDTSNSWSPATPDYAWYGTGFDWYVYASVNLDKQFAITLVPMLESRPIQLAIDGKITREWLLNEPMTRLTFPLAVSAGFHTLHFNLAGDNCIPVPVQPQCLVEGATYSAKDCALKPEERNMCVGVGYKLGSQNIAFGDSIPLTSKTINLANGMTFTGFRMPDHADAGGVLVIDISWHATQKLPGDFHLFAHVLDSAGTLITQADVVPGDGKFPTTAWAVDQQWDQTLQLLIQPGTPPGNYQVYTGWYRYPDLTRLSVTGDSPHAADGLVYLGTITIK